MNPYLILALVIAWVVSVAGVGYWQNGAGHTAELVTWQKRENAELRAANVKIVTLEETARKTEAAHATELDKIAQRHQREIADAEVQKGLDVAAARAGRIVLRIPVACKDTDRGGTPATAAAPGVGDGGATSELPREVTADLLALADDANAVVKQLGECQAVVTDDRLPRP